MKSAFAPAIPLVLGDRVQLQQVVLNLVLNACDAMNSAHATERDLALSTTAGDDFVELVVSDHGPGIPDDQLERVFEPFVTFREQGLGLGLAISRSIVTRARRVDPRREQCRRRRDVPLPSAGGFHRLVLALRRQPFPALPFELSPAPGKRITARRRL